MESGAGAGWQDDTSQTEVVCPRCGRGRLIRRKRQIDRLTLADRAPLGLYLRRSLRRGRYRRGTLKRSYLCELCGHQWQTYEAQTSHHMS